MKPETRWKPLYNQPITSNYKRLCAFLISISPVKTMINELKQVAISRRDEITSWVKIIRTWVTTQPKKKYNTSIVTIRG